jgi:putative tRNA adenosine deaminase-associated protein
MSYFAAVLTRTKDRWRGVEVDLDDCESMDDIADLLRDESGDVRLLVVEQDDEYVALARVDATDDEAHVFLSDGHAADGYPLAALIAEELGEIADPDESDDIDEADEIDDELVSDVLVAPGHDSAPLGDASVVDDLGTSASELLGLCAHEGTLPIDVIVAICEKAGCADEFEAIRA